MGQLDPSAKLATFANGFIKGAFLHNWIYTTLEASTGGVQQGLGLGNGDRTFKYSPSWTPTSPLLRVSNSSDIAVNQAGALFAVETHEDGSLQAVHWQVSDNGMPLRQGVVSTKWKQ
jgi:hypothetical protein